VGRLRVQRAERRRQFQEGRRRSSPEAVEDIHRVRRTSCEHHVPNTQGAVSCFFLFFYLSAFLLVIWWVCHAKKSEYRKMKMN
jgi:hypothetical protein